MGYLESKAMIMVLPPTKRGSVEERLLARRSCARAYTRSVLTPAELVEVLAMLDLEDA